MTTLKSIEILTTDIVNSVFTIKPKYAYNDLAFNIIKLCELIHDYEGESENIWYLCEHLECSIVSFIVGAYWHYTEYHQGQHHSSYAALSALGGIYDPNMECGAEVGTSEHECYMLLNQLAEETK